MRAIDGASFTGITSTQTGINLAGGRYAFVATSGTWGTGGTIGFQMPGANGAQTTVPIQNVPSGPISGFTANGMGVIEVPQVTGGQVLVTGTITGGNVKISGIPGE